MNESHEFDWDDHNERHLAKHGISRSEAEDVLSGSHVLLEYETEGNEARWVAVGATRSGLILNIGVCASRRRHSLYHRLVGGQRDGRNIHEGMGSPLKTAKAKMKPAAIPKFTSEAKEAAWWDAHRSEIEAEIRQRIKQDRPLTLDNILQGAKASQPITLRVSKEDLQTARRLAAQKGLGYQTYIKMLLREALAKKSEEGPSRASR